MSDASACRRGELKGAFRRLAPCGPSSTLFASACGVSAPRSAARGLPGLLCLGRPAVEDLRMLTDRETGALGLARPDVSYQSGSR